MVVGITGVLERIHSIERRFGIQQNLPTADFSSVLKDAQNSVAAVRSAKSVGTTDFHSLGSAPEIEKMLYLAAGKYGVDPKLALAVAKTESGLSPEAVSPAGAVGVMQLMPDTAKTLGVRDIQDPRENIDGGVRYLKDLLNMFHGDTNKALAAYNAGPQAVQAYGGVPPYRETQNYVSKVLSLYHG
ncbi:hypothetical protein P22_2176 [Propionispora sp. 2/2-37]|uniref:lytic transglycosylase domain-containing protein n=1 Tax=Propionispora sp. 2/2-37 TaxID=1677858 RepID=UPI0006BB77A3|nr:lytic transglycosylase domain-containing protein [Propionispora sp. 2/2-37]CUH96088.1 hypothetical protein P22_2176 [Propionispora sp. 2/2-37]